MTPEHPQWDEYQMRLKAEQNEKDEKARIEAEIQEWGAQEATELVKEMESAMAMATRSACSRRAVRSEMSLRCRKTRSPSPS